MTTPRNGISLYIYILYLYFSGFFVFFDVFCPILDFIDFLCTIAMFFDVFWKSIPSLRYSHFLTFLKSVPFKEMGFGFYRFFIFLAFFYRFLFYGSFFIFDFLSIFYRFLLILFFDRFLSNVASVGRFLFCEKPEKVEKSRKNDEKRGQKKRVEVGPFCTTPIFGQKSCFLPR